MADVSQIKLPNGSVYDLIDEKSGYITAEYIENKTDYEIPVSRVGEIVVGETAIGTDSTNFPTSKAVVDYVDERVVQEMDAIDVGVTGVKANGTSLSINDGVVNIPVVGPNQSVGLMTDEYMENIFDSIPLNTSQLNNDSGFITASDIPTTDLSGYMQKGTDYVTAGQKSGTTLGTKATAEGAYTTASGNYAHAEGHNTTASREATHAEGYNTTASGLYSHAEGFETTASGIVSHAQGEYTIASGNYSHAEGSYTIAQRKSQHVFGAYNIADIGGSDTGYKGTYIEIVGKGTSDNNRSNARTLDWSGNEVLAGKLTVGAGPTANMDVATKQYVDNSIPTVPTNISSFTNDSGYLTASDIASVMTYKGTKANYAALPSTGNTTGDVWHLTDTGAEWAWDGSAWQELGTAIDLSGYVEKSRTADSTTTVFLNSGTGGSIQSTYQGTDNEAYIQTTADDSGASIELYASDGTHYNQIYIGPIETYIGNILTPVDNTDAANKKYVDDSIGALSIPTKTSDLTNDSGFLTSYTETDPTVPSWAKQSSKPSYGLTEISGTDDLRAIEALTGTFGLLKKTAANTWTLDTSTYLTSYTETDPVFSASAAAGITSTDISNWNNKTSNTGTITSVRTTAGAHTTINISSGAANFNVPTHTSHLTNDSGYLTLATLPIYNGTVE